MKNVLVITDAVKQMVSVGNLKFTTKTYMTESVIGIVAVLQNVDLPKRPTLQIATFKKIFFLQEKKGEEIVVFRKLGVRTK